MKVTFPHMGNMWIPVKALFDYLEIEFIVPPPNSKHTLSVGTQHSPEGACLPFKLNVGNLIDAAKLGADTFVMTGGVGPCRFGYYGELERQILHDLGIEMELIILEPPEGSLLGLAKRIKQAASHKPWIKILGAVRFAYRKAVAMDRIEDLVHWARPRAEQPLAIETIYRRAQTELNEANNSAAIEHVVKRTREQVLAVPRKQDFTPVKVGIVGEIYTLLDPFASLDIERHLGHLGVEVDRSIYLSGWINEHIFQGVNRAYKEVKQYKQLAHPFLAHSVGGHGQETVGGTVEFGRQEFAGVIHLLPLSCMPEIVAASILPNVGRQYNLPVMTLYIDEQSGQAGVLTRLEAFVDLINRRQSQPSCEREVRHEQIVFGG
ncbi:MAG: CoA protein activase [Peptococcaceae bacterium]|nr:CoA protein activase [Peptococcaceae bacterium]